MVLSDNSNLWLAETLWRLGAVEFGDFTLGRTAVGSPVYLNVRKLIGHPTSLWRAAHVIHEEITALQSMRNPQMDRFDLVAGVPLGGLHVATAYSLTAKVPMIYLHPDRTKAEIASGEVSAIEGVFAPNQQAIIMDDLVTGGGSIAETAERLRDAGLLVKDAFVLVDRQQGARERLKKDGINLRAALTLEVILNYLMSSNLIEEKWYRRSMDYLEASGLR
jgi:orotate phosphoribosyltransferase/uridine monophosphate synthetase